MLTVEQLAKELDLEILELPEGDREITGGYAGDLLSWVMGRAEAGDAWVTIMSNMNVAAVAQLVDVSCVIFAEGVRPDKEAVERAKLHGINMLAAQNGMFEICAEISSALERKE